MILKYSTQIFNIFCCFHVCLLKFFVIFTRVHKNEIQRFDVPRGEQHSPLLRQSARSVGEAVVISSVEAEVVLAAVADEAAVRTLVFTWPQAQETLLVGSFRTGSLDGICFAFAHYILKTSAMF